MQNLLPDLQFSVICEDVVQDKLTGKLIFYGIFDALGAARFPVEHKRLFVVNRWCNGDGEFAQRTKILSPDRKKLAETSDIKFSLPNTKSKHTSIERFDNIILEKPGIYWLEVYLNGDLKLSCNFEVVDAGSPR